MRPARVSSLRPRLRTVSIMPGIENLAPERTETSSGLSGSPKPLPERASTSCIASRTSSQRPVGQLLAGREVVVAGFGRDGEARRGRQAGEGHLGQAGALAAEQVLHGAVAFGAARRPRRRCSAWRRVGARGRSRHGQGTSGVARRGVAAWGAASVRGCGRLAWYRRAGCPDRPAVRPLRCGRWSACAPAEPVQVRTRRAPRLHSRGRPESHWQPGPDR